jgi:histidinol-phosphate aminotransferase
MKDFYKPSRNFNKLLLDRNENLDQELNNHINFLINQEHHNCNLYPDNLWQLNKNISEYHGVSQSEVILTNGSEEALNIIFALASLSYKAIVKWEPTFTLIGLFAERYNMPTINYDYVLTQTNEFNFNYKQVKNLPQDKYVFYISSPNSPTGSIFCKDTLRMMLNNFTTSLFILDGAYVDYDIDWYVNLYKRYNNIVITRTFSKSWGIAGLRAGYYISKDPKLQNARPNYAPSIVTSTIVNKLFDASFVISSSINENVCIKRLLETFLTKNKISFIRGKGNFILIETSKIDLNYLSKFVLYKTLNINNIQYLKLSIPSKTYLHQLCNLLVRN